MTIEEQLTLDDGHRFQKKLGELIAENGYKLIMETGSGVSSIYALKAMDNANIDGVLYSIDPAMWYPHPIEHPKFVSIKKKSIDAIIPLYLETGAFDVCVTDGDHEILAQTYEYEMLYRMLKPGGWLICDDVGWNNNGAWTNFLDRYDFVEEFFGDARCIHKPLGEPVLGFEVTEFGSSMDKVEVQRFHDEWLDYCTNLEKEWLAAGNQKHPAFQ